MKWIRFVITFGILILLGWLLFNFGMNSFIQMGINYGLSLSILIIFFGLALLILLKLKLIRL